MTRHAHPRQRGDIAGLLLGLLAILVIAAAYTPVPA